MHKIFVYGTLKKGQGNHYLLRNFQREGVDKIQGLMYDLGHFPGVVFNHTDEDKYVHGEVYTVDDETLKRLDHLEGVPHLYTREKVRLLDSHGEAYTYFFAGKLHGAKLLEEGVWK